MMENLSLSPLVIHEQKESAEKERERDGEKAAAASECAYKVSLPRSSLCFLSLTGERKRKKVSLSC